MLFRSDALYPRYGTKVEVQLKNGSKLESKLLDAHGTPADPCSEDEAKEKFRCLAAVALDTKSIDAMLSLAERMESLPSVEPLSKALRG